MNSLDLLLVLERWEETDMKGVLQVLKRRDLGSEI